MARNIWDDSARNTLDDASLKRYLNVERDCINRSHLFNHNTIYGIGDKAQLTPLAAACCRGHIEVVKRLLLNGAKVNTRCPDDRTALYYATRACPPKNRLAVINAVIEAKPNLNEVYPKDGNWTPLMNAIEELQDKEVVHALVDAGASPTTRAMKLAEERDMEEDLLKKEDRNSTTGSPQRSVMFEIGNPKTVEDFKNNARKFVSESGFDKFFRKNDPFLQRLAEKASALSKDTTTPLSDPENIKRLTHLSLYQPVIYCDDSGSMATDNTGAISVNSRYKDQCELVARIARVATRIVPDLGVELRFINSPNQGKFTTTAEIDAAMKAVEPRGCTEIGTNLVKKILEPLVYNKISDPNHRFDRPILVCAITDGCPYPEPEDTFQKAVMGCVDKLDASRFEPTSVMFVMSQIGNDRQAAGFLNGLAEEEDIQQVLYCTTDQLDSKFEEMKHNEGRLEVWLLEMLTKPLMQS